MPPHTGQLSLPFIGLDLYIRETLQLGKITFDL